MPSKLVEKPSATEYRSSLKNAHQVLRVLRVLGRLLIEILKRHERGPVVVGFVVGQRVHEVGADRRREAEILLDRGFEVARAVGVLIDVDRSPRKSLPKTLVKGRAEHQTGVAAPRRSSWSVRCIRRP